MNRTLLPCVLVVAGLVGLPTTTSAGEIRLGELLPDSASQDWGELHTDASVQGKPLSIGGRHFAHGLGTHANSEITYELDGKCTSFSAWVGVDYGMKGYTESSVVFQVFGDGKKLFDSGVMRLNDAAKQLTVPLAGVDELKLVVTDAGNGIGCDHADWCEPVLSGEKPAEAVAVAKYQVTTPGLTLSFDEAAALSAVPWHARGANPARRLPPNRQGGRHATTRRRPRVHAEADRCRASPRDAQRPLHADQGQRPLGNRDRQRRCPLEYEY